MRAFLLLAVALASAATIAATTTTASSAESLDASLSALLRSLDSPLSFSVDPVEVATVAGLLKKMEAGIDAYDGKLGAVDKPRLDRLSAELKVVQAKAAKISKQHEKASLVLAENLRQLKVQQEEEAKEVARIEQDEAAAETVMGAKQKRVHLEVSHVEQQRAYIGRVRASLDRIRVRLEKGTVDVGKRVDGAKHGATMRAVLSFRGYAPKDFPRAQLGDALHGLVRAELGIEVGLSVSAANLGLRKGGASTGAPKPTVGGVGDSARFLAGLDSKVRRAEAIADKLRNRAASVVADANAGSSASLLLEMGAGRWGRAVENVKAALAGAVSGGAAAAGTTPAAGLFAPSKEMAGVKAPASPVPATEGPQAKIVAEMTRLGLLNSPVVAVDPVTGKPAPVEVVAPAKHLALATPMKASPYCEVAVAISFDAPNAGEAKSMRTGLLYVLQKKIKVLAAIKAVFDKAIVAGKITHPAKPGLVLVGVVVDAGSTDALDFAVEKDAEELEKLMEEADEQAEDEVDTCEAKADTCDRKTSTCVVGIGNGGFSCDCIAPLMDVGGKCVMPDPCSTGTHDCDANAKCAVTDAATAAHTCTCAKDFTDETPKTANATGFVCEPVNPCAAKKHQCDPHAACIPAGANKYQCRCLNGFVGDGVACTPFKADPCAKCNAATETCVKGKSCACRFGFTRKDAGNAKSPCVPVDLCTTSANTCHPTRGLCSTTASAGKAVACACRDAYAGNGKKCEPKDPCKDGTHQCDTKNGGCDYVGPNDYKCRCRNGLVLGMDGLKCEIDPCSEGGAATCDRDNGVCTTLDGGKHKCDCKKGFAGDGRKCTLDVKNAGEAAKHGFTLDGVLALLDGRTSGHMGMGAAQTQGVKEVLEKLAPGSSKFVPDLQVAGGELSYCQFILRASWKLNVGPLKDMPLDLIGGVCGKPVAVVGATLTADNVGPFLGAFLGESTVKAMMDTGLFGRLNMAALVGVSTAYNKLMLEKMGPAFHFQPATSPLNALLTKGPLPMMDVGLVISLAGKLEKQDPAAAAAAIEACSGKLACRLLALTAGGASATGTIYVGKKSATGDFGVGLKLTADAGSMSFGNGMTVTKAKLDLSLSYGAPPAMSLLQIGEAKAAGPSLSSVKVGLGLSGSFNMVMRKEANSSKAVEEIVGTLKADLGGDLGGSTTTATVKTTQPWRGAFNVLEGRLNFDQLEGKLDLDVPSAEELVKGGAAAGLLRASGQMCLGKEGSCFPTTDPGKAIEGRAFVVGGLAAGASVAANKDPVAAVESAFAMALVKEVTINNAINAFTDASFKIPIIGGLGISGQEHGCPALPATGPVTLEQMEAAAPCSLAVTAALAPQSASAVGAMAGVKAGVRLSGGIKGLFEIFGVKSSRMKFEMEVLMAPKDDTIKAYADSVKKKKGFVMPGSVAAVYVDLDLASHMRLFGGLVTIADKEGGKRGPRLLVDVKTKHYKEALVGETKDGSFTTKDLVTQRGAARDAQRGSRFFKSVGTSVGAGEWSVWLGGHAKLLGAGTTVEVEVRNDAMHLHAEAKLWGLFMARFQIDAAYGKAQSNQVCVRGMLQNDFMTKIREAVRGGLSKAKDAAMKTMSQWQDKIRVARVKIEDAKKHLKAAQAKFDGAANGIAAKRADLKRAEDKVENVCFIELFRGRMRARRAAKAVEAESPSEAAFLELLRKESHGKKLTGTQQALLTKQHKKKWGRFGRRVSSFVTRTIPAVVKDTAGDIARAAKAAAAKAKAAGCFIVKNTAKLGLKAAQGALWLAEKAVRAAKVTLKAAEVVMSLANVALSGVIVGLEGAKMVVKGGLAVADFLAKHLLGGLFDIKRIGFNVYLGNMKSNSLCVVLDLVVLGKARTLKANINLGSFGGFVSSLINMVLGKGGLAACTMNCPMVDFKQLDNDRKFPWIDAKKVIAALAAKKAAAARAHKEGELALAAERGVTHAAHELATLSSSSGVSDCKSFDTFGTGKWMALPPGMVMPLSGFLQVKVRGGAGTLGLVQKARDHTNMYRVGLAAGVTTLSRGEAVKVTARGTGAIWAGAKTESVFWVSYGSGSVVVGKGAVVGKGQVARWNDPSPLDIKKVQAMTGMAKDPTRWRVCPALDCVADFATEQDASAWTALPHGASTFAPLQFQSTRAVVVGVRAKAAAVRMHMGKGANAKVYDVSLTVMGDASISSDGEVVVRKAGAAPGVLDMNEMRSFWVSFDGELKVGRGDAVGKNGFLVGPGTIGADVTKVEVRLEERRVCVFWVCGLILFRLFW